MALTNLIARWLRTTGRRLAPVPVQRPVSQKKARRMAGLLERVIFL
jgi:hypothetical protein